MFVFTEQDYIDAGGSLPWTPTAKTYLAVTWAQVVRAANGQLDYNTSITVFDRDILTYIINVMGEEAGGITSESFEGYSYSRDPGKKADISILILGLLDSMGLGTEEALESVSIGPLDCGRC